MKKVWFVLPILLILFYLAGPTPGPQNMNPVQSLPDSLDALDRMILERESSLPLKPDNQARIVWADSFRFRQTDVAVVYIHGFSASYGEGAPFHLQLARRLGANLFIARLNGHGLRDPDALKGIQAQDFAHSAVEAIEIGRRLGRRVVVCATSMGGALAMHEVARNDSAIAALLVYSPLIAFRDPTTMLLNKPWGKEIASRVVGGNYYVSDPNPSENVARYWYDRYHIDGLVAVKDVQARTAKPELWKQITIPVFVAYYLKSEQEQDATVSAPAIEAMSRELGTTEAWRDVHNFTEARAHVLTSEYTTAVWPEVLTASLNFVTRVLAEKTSSPDRHSL